VERVDVGGGRELERRLADFVVEPLQFGLDVERVE
jgi:hypothetical protein